MWPESNNEYIDVSKLMKLILVTIQYDNFLTWANLHLKSTNYDRTHAYY